MNEIDQKLENLAHKIIEIHGGYVSMITWDEYIEAFNLGLDTVSYIKTQSNVSNDEWYILRKLIEELLKNGIHGPVTDIKSYKRVKLSKLTEQLEQELASIPYVRDEVIEIKTLNDWIKSLQIYKLVDKFLSTSYYQTSYDLYQDIRKIVLTKNSSMYKKIYAGRVIDKISSEDNQGKIPNGINLCVEDYELTELVRLIKNNPDFNFKLMKFSYQKAIINERLETGEWSNNLLLLLKKGKVRKK